MKSTLVFLALCAAAFADGPIDEGNRAFAEGRYRDAVRHYLEAQEKIGLDPDLLFNLGNAYARAGDTGRAVLSYERARLLAPRDAGIRDALVALRRGAGLEGDLDRSWADFHRHLTQDEWSLLGAVAGTILLVAFLGRRRLSRAALARLAAAAVLAALPAATAITKHALDGSRSIVVSPEASELHTSPDEAAESSGRLLPGQVVWTSREHEEFVLVRRSGGVAGWVARAVVERVAP